VPAADTPFAYAILRVVPHVERGEQFNVGVVLFCRQLDYLDLRTRVDAQRLMALAPDLDLAEVRASLEAIGAVVCGDPTGGALARLPASERFGWLVAPASTVIQPSKVHTGLTQNPGATLERLFGTLVHAPGMST